MNFSAASLEALIRDSKHALVIGVGGGGDVAGALATARLLKILRSALHALGIATELDYIRKSYPAALTK